MGLTLSGGLNGIIQGVQVRSGAARLHRTQKGCALLGRLTKTLGVGKVMERLKATIPYLVYLVVWSGLYYFYPRFFSSDHYWENFGQRIIFGCLAYPVAILVAKKTGELKAGVLFGILTTIFVVIWIYVKLMFDRMNAAYGGETFFSINGMLSYEYWSYTLAEFLSFTALPVLFLVLLNHLTRHSSRTRKRAA